MFLREAWPASQTSVRRRRGLGRRTGARGPTPRLAGRLFRRLLLRRGLGLGPCVYPIHHEHVPLAVTEDFSITPLPDCEAARFEAGTKRRARAKLLAVKLNPNPREELSSRPSFDQLVENHDFPLHGPVNPAPLQKSADGGCPPKLARSKAIAPVPYSRPFRDPCAGSAGSRSWGSRSRVPQV